jgi:hypothetical protein
MRGNSATRIGEGGAWLLAYLTKEWSLTAENGCQYWLLIDVGLGMQWVTGGCDWYSDTAVVLWRLTRLNGARRPWLMAGTRALSVTWLARHGSSRRHDDMTTVGQSGEGWCALL